MQLKDNFVLEPEGRNTAPAIALVALELVRRDPDAVMLVVPADHVVKGQKEFEAAVALAAELAEQGLLVTFGIKPIRPETGYGYIKPDRKKVLGKRRMLKGYRVGRFVEKPDAVKAAQYLKAGDYYWNSGMFVWRAATILEEIRRHQPALGRGMDRIGRLMEQKAARTAIDDEYRELPSISIDNGVMEQSDKAAMVPVSFKWSDVGSWGSLDEVAAKDKAGNVVSGRVVDLGQPAISVVFADRRVVATIGLDRHGGGRYSGCHAGLPKVPSAGRKKGSSRFSSSSGAPEHLEHLTVIGPGAPTRCSKRDWDTR